MLSFARQTNNLSDYLMTHMCFSQYFSSNNNGYFSEFDLNEEINDGSVSENGGCCSKPFLAVDVIWNLGFVFVSFFVLLSTFNEKPLTPLRVWIFVYAFQCVLHVVLVYGGSFHQGLGFNRNVTRLESVNTIASSFWWVFGFYWIVTGGQALVQDSPHLYWLVVVFLALDVFCMMFCVGLACIICMGLFCCIPIVAIAYAMTVREGASEEDIEFLPKHRFHKSYAPRTSTYMERGNELALHIQDSECCICLTQYTEGAELCSLPCNHHFHNVCISRWLRINATCPLCKFNIKAKADTLV